MLIKELHCIYVSMQIAPVLRLMRDISLEKLLNWQDFLFLFTIRDSKLKKKKKIRFWILVGKNNKEMTF